MKTAYQKHRSWLNPYHKGSKKAARRRESHSVTIRLNSLLEVAQFAAKFLKSEACNLSGNIAPNKTTALSLSKSSGDGWIS